MRKELLLIRFWAVTPVGKLVFNREGIFGWRMAGTKGQITSVKVCMPFEQVTAEDVLKNFGWPSKEFKPYGHDYEEVEEIKKIEPVLKNDISVITCIRQGDRIFSVAPDGTPEIFVKQKDKNDGQN